MPTFTIIGGVNGTGKSSLSGVLKECLNNIGVLVDPDQLTAQHNGNEYEGGRAAIARLQDCLARHIDFTEESTLSGSFSRKMARAARDAGYTVQLYYVGLDTAEESVRRIANRVARGGHDIPAQDVHRRFARRFRDLAKLLPLCNEATFYDNDNGFRVVAFYRNGELLSATDAPPAWLLELRKEIAPQTMPLLCQKRTSNGGAQMDKKQLQHNFIQYLKAHYQYARPEIMASNVFYAWNHDIGMDFWDIFASEESMLTARQLLIRCFEDTGRKDPSGHASVYYGCWKKFKEFCDSQELPNSSLL